MKKHALHVPNTAFKLEAFIDIDISDRCRAWEDELYTHSVRNVIGGYAMCAYVVDAINELTSAIHMPIEDSMSHNNRNEA